MKRYEKIDWLNGSRIIDYEIPKKEFEDSITDKSHFIPMSESVKRIKNMAPISGDTIKIMYDFPNGRDNGAPLPIGRKIGHDIAELSTAIRQDSEYAKKELIKGAKNKKIADEVDRAMTETVGNVSKSNVNNNSTSTV